MEAKIQFMLDNFKRTRPATYRRIEREWNEKVDMLNTEPAATTSKIDWTKPLKCDRSAVVTVKYLHGVPIYDGTKSDVYHACLLTYANGYSYIVLYDESGKSAGNNGGTINVKNVAVPEDVSAWMVLDKTGGIISSKHRTKEAAQEWAGYNRGYIAAREFQYVHYNYTQAR
jgi:hypothetical protein